MTSDLRVCFVGDSFVAGVGDPEHRGWVGRLAARASASGLPLTAYNLGVRRQTSGDVLDRWAGECAQRLPAGAGADCRIVLSVGVNDTTEENGAVRVPPDRSAANLDAVLTGAATSGWPVLVVGPPPVADAAQNSRTLDLNNRFSAVCLGRNVRYVDVTVPLLADPAWTAEVAAGDGAHPAAGGYRALADLVCPDWLSWLGSADARPQSRH